MNAAGSFESDLPTLAKRKQLQSHKFPEVEDMQVLQGRESSLTGKLLRMCLLPFKQGMLCILFWHKPNFNCGDASLKLWKPCTSPSKMQKRNTQTVAAYWVDVLTQIWEAKTPTGFLSMNLIAVQTSVRHISAKPLEVLSASFLATGHPLLGCTLST